jgi:hypothetical protein
MTNRQKTLQDLGLTNADATKLETILSNDENGKPRSNSDQEFVHSVVRQLQGK